jgi:hypothetical protein
MNNYDYSARFIDFISTGAKSPTLSTGVIDAEKLGRVAAVLEKAKLHPKHTQINLISFLILPIQRLPRYKLLLTSLLKETTHQHPDHLKLGRAVQDIQELIEFCNETKRECESKSKSLTSLTKIVLHSCLNLLKQYKPCPDRELLFESDGLSIVKYVDHVNSLPILNPLVLCKNKKSQFQFQQKKSIKEWKFKMHRDSSQSKIARLIEEGGAASKYDIPNIQGKKCSIYICNDILLITNSSNQLCGVSLFNAQTTASCLPLIISREAREGVLRFSNGDGILYVRGELEEVAHLVALVNSLL